MQNTNSNTSLDLERAARLRQPEVNLLLFSPGYFFSMILDGAKIKANASVKQSKNADALDKENDCIIVLPVSRLHLKGFKKEKMNLI